MILGIYSKKKQLASGFGATRHSAEQKTYWFVRRMDDDNYEIQPLNQNHVPSGVTSTISKGTFMKEYVPEVDYYERQTLPALQTLRRKLDRGEELFQMDQLDAAESEFAKALSIDEDNPQANLRQGDIACRKKDFKKLKQALQRIMGIDKIFVEAERHRFNEFGMNLRKEGFFSEAVAYYSKALQVSSQDEHLYFNIARVFHQMGNQSACLQHLEDALRINPAFEQAQRFLGYCRQTQRFGAETQPDLETF